MNKHRSIIITSFAIFILLSCFAPLSEGGTLLPLDTFFGEPLCSEGYTDNQHPLMDSLLVNFQTRGSSAYTLFCSDSAHFFFSADLSSCIVEKRSILPKWKQYIGISQRPPPLFTLNHTFNSNR